MNENSNLKIFGENIKKLRLLKKLSQEEFAYRAGLDRTYIGGVERGERNLSLINIIKIADALSMDVKDLFDDIK